MKRLLLGTFLGMFLPGVVTAADNLADAEDTPFNVWVTESSQYATTEPAEPSITGGKTIWRKFTTTKRCIVTVKISETTDMVTNLHVYRGDDYDSLNLVEGGTPRGELSFPADAGMTFRICIGSFYYVEHDDITYAVVQSTWPYGTDQVVSPPEPTEQTVPNDSFETPQPIPSPQNRTTVIGYMGNATTQPNESEDSTGSHAVWYSWKAPYDGTLRIVTPSSPNDLRFGHRIGVFTGNDPGAPTMLDTVQGKVVDLTVPVRSGVTYRIAFGFKDYLLNFGSFPYSYAFELLPRRSYPDIEVVSPDGRVLVDGSSKLDLGKVKLRRTGAKQTLLIRNKGKAPLTGLTVRKTGSNPSDFIAGTIYPRTINPGGTGSFKVRFKPRKKGSRSATIRIISNDPDESPFDIKCKGKGFTKR